MSEFVDSIVNDLKQEFHDTMESIGGEIVADVRKSISTKVRIIRGRKIRSVSPNPPFYDDGGLWLSVAMENTISAKSVMLLIYCPGKLPGWLEYGTKYMGKREFFTPAFDRWVPRVISAVGGDSVSA